MSADNNILDFNGLSKYHSKIKNTLSAKVGYIRVVGNNEQYFADSESADLYDTGLDQYTNLLLGSVPLPEGGGGGGGYLSGAVINVITPMYNAVKLGSKGHTVKFSVDILNNQGQSTGEQIDLRIITTHNANTQTQKINARAGQVLTVSVDDYLKEGTNTISIKITGKTSGSNTMVAVTYDVVNLVLEDYYEAAQYVDMREGSAILQVPYFISGYGTKKMEWYIDGEAVPFVKEDDEIVESSAERTKYINIPVLNQGRHSLQYRASTVVNGETFYTDTIYHDLLVYTGNITASFVGISVTIPSKYGILSSGSVPTIYNMEQFVPYELKFFAFSPESLVLDIEVQVDGEIIGNVSSSNNVGNSFTYTPMTAGNKEILFKVSDSSTYSVEAEVNSTSLSLEEINNALDLDFNGNGRSNASADRNIWKYGNYTGTFEGFEWNERSGWNGDRLVISEGCSFSIDAKPLNSKTAEDGKTIEIEFKSTNVSDDNAVFLDLRDNTGAGILVSATKVAITSNDGVTIETEYKEDELIRIGFVINRSQNATRKGLTLIYCNGISSRCINRAATDGYDVDKSILFTGSEGATMELKAVRIYNTALSDDQMYNNYNLYRDSLEEMLDLYDKNDIYEEGTYNISLDKAGRRIPYMLVTGDIPVLENTTDKNEQITVDIEYVNSQNPELNFTMEGAAMRPQGTSSMGYPKKNFRFYTLELPDTILRDYRGVEIEDKLYSFRKGAQPVGCWCLKADYAESSGTHNTAIARMWGNALKNVSIEIDGKKEYVCQTNAQKAATANNYSYDVRTTIDGFPILLFYRKNKQDTPIFIGKYNFNNDKSTESVFGFTGIPGFDNSRMQCWEILNNGNPLALFTSSEGFDEGWKEAFESRYPDTKTPNTSDLKAFCNWMSAVTKEEFVAEKHQHLNLWMMAAYYCYLMRHAGADQFVKNAMLTSEDGKHFYFILYDNDTINGLINTGHLKIKPTDDRNSIGEDGSYLFAGHDSRLWNMLEDDEEFMNMVSQIDNALYTAGISYRNAIKEFDEEQADKWCERIYNQDAQYKYVGPFTNNNVNNLFMMQGSRALHRRWFLAKRFGIYDAKFVSGTYKSQSIEIKCINDTEPGQQFQITSSYPLHYGYGINNVPRESGIYLEPDEKYTFVTSEKLNLGDPLRIYAAHNLKKVDFSAMMDRLSVVNIAGVYDEDLGTRMKELVIGNPIKENVSVTAISGLGNALKLEQLDVRNMKGLTSIDLSNSSYLKKVWAKGSNITSAVFATGAPIEYLQLPDVMKVLNFNSLPYLQYSGIDIADKTSINEIRISNCPNLSNDFNWVYDWYTTKTAENKKAVLIMDKVAWENVDYTKLIELANIGTLTLKGRAKITEGSQEIIDELKSVFGDNVFNRASEFYIQAPDGVYLSGPTKLLEGESARYVCAAFDDEGGRIQFSLPTTRQGCNIDAVTGVLTTTENGLATSDILVRAVFISNSGKVVETTMPVTIEKRSYPTQISIEGNALVSEERSTFTLTTTPAEITGLYRVDWTLGDASAEYLVVEESNNTSCVIKRIKEGVLETTLTATIVKLVDNSTVNTTTKNISLVLPGVVLTKSSNAPLQECLYKAGLVAHEDYSEAWELALITADQLQPGTSDSTSIFYNYISRITSLSELKYFTGLTRIKAYTFSKGYSIDSVNTIELPDSIEFIGEYAFRGIRNLDKLVVPNNIVIAETYSFYDTFANRLYIPNLEKWANSVYVRYGYPVKSDGTTKIFLENYEKEAEEVVFDFEISSSSQNRYNFKYWSSIKRWVINNSKVYINMSSSYGDMFLNVNVDTKEGFKLYPSSGDLYIGENVTSIKGDFVINPFNNIHIDTLEHWFNIDYDNKSGNPLSGDYSLYVGDSEVPEDIVIPDSITEVKPYALCKWNKLKSVRFHKDVTSISDASIYGCLNINQLVVDSDNKKYDSRENCNAVIESDIDKLILACVNTHIVEGVKILLSTSFVDIVPETLDLPNTIEQIVGNVFKSSRTLKKINIHSFNTWMSVGGSIATGTVRKSLYLNGELIENFIIPDGVEKVSGSIFGDIELKSITIPSSVKEAYSICYLALIEKLIIKKRRSYLAFASSSFSYCKTLREVYVDDLETYMYCDQGSTGGYSFFNSVQPEFYSETKLFVNGELLENLVLTPDLYEIAKNTKSWRPPFANIGSIKSVYVENGWRGFDVGFLKGCVNVKTISMEISSVVSSQGFDIGSYCFGSSNDTYTGRNTYNTGENILYVPQGATGYDSGYWLDPLQNASKCGFTISYTL